MTLLTAKDVLDKAFPETKFTKGYDQVEVDNFLDLVVAAMQHLEAENAELKAKLEAATGRVEELGEEAASGAAVEVTPIEETTVVEQAPADAEATAPAQAVAAVDQNASTEAVPATASGMLELAQRLHDEHVSNGKAEGEQILTEARTAGERIVREAEDQRDRTLFQLEKERSGLEHKIDELRRFESDYRTRLKSYLSNLLTNVEDGQESSSPSL